jgi:Asp/Glu/hydantoin racemase
VQSQPLIALISATPAAIGPATSGLAARFPNAGVWNILDDRLLVEANDAGAVTPVLSDRMERLIDHAVLGGATGILLTCSMYGTVAHDYPADEVPVLAADDAAFDAAIDGGFARIVLVASFEAALADAVDRFRGALAEAGSPSEVLPVVAPDAMAATKSGDVDALCAALAAACSTAAGFDAVLLAQYSLAPAAEALASVLGVPVIAGPIAAATRLQSLLGDPQ